MTKFRDVKPPNSSPTICLRLRPFRLCLPRPRRSRGSSPSLPVNQQPNGHSWPACVGVEEAARILGGCEASDRHYLSLHFVLTMERSRFPFSSAHSLFSMFYSSVRIRRQPNANEFPIVSSINILMSKSGGGPGDPSTAKCRGWFDQLSATDFLVATGRQTGLDQFAPVVKKKSGIPVYGHMDARPIYQLGHGTGLPDFLTGGRFQANEIPARFGAVNIITQQHTGGCIA